MDRMDGTLTIKVVAAFYPSNIKSVEHIRNYRIPPEKEDYELPVEDEGTAEQQQPEDTVPSQYKSQSNLRLIPPPVFSRVAVPQIYK